MGLLKLLHEAFQLVVLQTVDSLTALGVKIFFVAEGVLNIKQFLACHKYNLLLIGCNNSMDCQVIFYTVRIIDARDSTKNNAHISG